MSSLVLYMSFDADCLAKVPQNVNGENDLNLKILKCPPPNFFKLNLQVGPFPCKF